MRIIGLDLSTSVAGWCVFEDGKLEKFDYYKFKKPNGGDWEHIDLVDQFYEHIYEDLENADMVVIEDSLKRFAGGFSSSTSITKLLQFNAIVTYTLRKRLGRDNVIHLHPATARKSSLGRGTKPSDYDDTKEWVKDRVAEKFDITWPRTRYDNVRQEASDMADSIVLADAYIQENTVKT